MDFDKLLTSIADRAPSLHHNDTVLVNGDTWWTVVGDKKSADRRTVTSDLAASLGISDSALDDLQFYCGTALSVWGLCVGGFALVAYLFPATRRQPSDYVGFPVSGSIETIKNQPPLSRRRQWTAINLIVVQLIAAVLLLATPITVRATNQTGEDHNDGDDFDVENRMSMSMRWKYGPTACRAWLLVRVWIGSATMWASFAALFDGFLVTVTPSSQLDMDEGWTAAVDPTPRSMTQGIPRGKGLSRAVMIVLAVLATWLAAAMSTVPTVTSVGRTDFILEEVCAINVTSAHALYIVMSSYIVPACLVLVVSIGLLAAYRRSRHVAKSADDSEYVNAPSNYSRLGARKLEADSHDYDVIDDCRKPVAAFRRSYVGCGLRCLSAWLAVIGWLPFQSIGVMVALCGADFHMTATDSEQHSLSDVIKASQSPPSSMAMPPAGTELPMCIDPGIWTAFYWIGQVATVGLVPFIWLTADLVDRSRVGKKGLCNRSHCGCRKSKSSGSYRSTAASTCTTDLSSAGGSRRRLDDSGTL